MLVGARVASATSLLVLDYNGAKEFGSVHISGGAIDITNGAMIVTTSSFGFVPNGGQLNEYGSPGVAEFGDAAIHDAIVEGANYANGFWDGTNGIMSSTAYANPSSNTAIGWIDNSIGAYTTFRGEPIGPGQSIIAYTYYGDADLSGNVDTSDYLLWSANYKVPNPIGLYGGNYEWIDADFDQNSTIDTSDYLLWSENNYNMPPLYTAGPAVPWTTGAARSVEPVPEPKSFSMVIVAAACLACWVVIGKTGTLRW
jgi:hypothetical protein